MPCLFFLSKKDKLESCAVVGSNSGAGTGFLNGGGAKDYGAHQYHEARTPWDALSCYLSLTLQHSDILYEAGYKNHRRSKLRGGARLLRPPPPPSGSVTEIAKIFSMIMHAW